MSGGIVTVARGIAAALADRFEVTYPAPPSQPEAWSATVIPTGSDNPRFGRTVGPLKFDVVLAAPVNDFDQALDWLADQIVAVHEALAADRTCGGTCQGVTVSSWGEFFATTLGGGADALAVRLTLSPTYPA